MKDTHQKPKLEGIIVKEYLDKFPICALASLARKIYKDNPLVFNNVEQIRSLLRYYTGSLGNKGRKSIEKSGNYTIHTNNYGIPNSENIVKEPYKIPTRNDKVLVISDLHMPYHDVEAIETALNFGLRKEVNTIIINGDLFDFYKLSRFEKDLRKRDIGYEIECGKIFLKRLRELFPEALIVYYLGNHDLWYKRFLYSKAPELLGIAEVELNFILGLKELNIVYLDNNRGITLGDLNIRHGHEFFGSGGVHPARTYYLKAKANILVSHVHRTSFFQANDIKRKIHGGWSIGCLSDLSPDYNINSEYNHGCAYIETQKDGSFVVENKMIIHKRLL